MLEQILQYLRNWFVVAKYAGVITIRDGQLTEFPGQLREGQYFRILGSVLGNDGVYRYGDGLDMADETFDGYVWALAVPKGILMLLPEIEAWQKKYGDVVASPYTSESYAGYSYSKGAMATDGSGGGWMSAFAARLAPWRKL